MRSRTVVAALVVSVAVLAGIVYLVKLTSGGRPPIPPVFKEKKVTIVLEDVAGVCKIKKDTNETKRIKAGDDDDVVEWHVKNKCASAQTVTVYDFTFKGEVPAGQPNGTCGSSNATYEPCPVEGETGLPCTPIVQTVKPKQGGNDGKAPIARGVNTSATKGHCYDYKIKIAGDTWDPEFVIWR